jgi:hypothetical protein
MHTLEQRVLAMALTGNSWSHLNSFCKFPLMTPIKIKIYLRRLFVKEIKMHICLSRVRFSGQKLRFQQEFMCNSLFQRSLHSIQGLKICKLEMSHNFNHNNNIPTTNHPFDRM